MTFNNSDPNPDVYLDNWGCPSGGCNQDDIFAIDPSQFTSGQTYTVTVTVTDTIGNQSSQSFQLTTDGGQAQAQTQAGKTDYSCPSASPTTTPSGTFASGAQASSVMQSNWPAVTTLGTAVTQDSGPVLPVLDITQSPPAVTGAADALSISNQAPAFTLGQDTDKVCVSRDATTSDARPATLLSAPGGASGVAELFPNTSASTDTTLRPTPYGVEGFEQLRDASAPQTFAWDVALHDGQQLQQLSDGDVAVINGPDTQSQPPDPNWTPPPDAPALPDPSPPSPPAAASDNPSWFASAMSLAINQVPDVGAQLQSADAHATTAYDLTQGQVVAVFHTPVAVDAAGRGVPASLSTAGNQVTMTVSHLGGGYTYPILADPTATSARAAKVQGISSENHELYDRWNETGLPQGRLRARFAKHRIPWRFGTQALAEVNAWITSAHNAQNGQLRVMLSLDECRSGNPYKCPSNPQSVGEYEANFRLWRKALPGVHDWGAWNEPNGVNVYASNPQGAQTVAHFWQAAQRECDMGGPRCTVLAGEFGGIGFNLQQLYATTYVKTLGDKKYYKGKLPSIWGFHDYSDFVHFKKKNPHPTTPCGHSRSSYEPTGSLVPASGSRRLARPPIWQTGLGCRPRSRRPTQPTTSSRSPRLSAASQSTRPRTTRT